MQAAQIHTDRFDSVRDQLITNHIELARRIALRVARNVPSWMNEEDLVSAAMIGLTEAAQRYDDTRNEAFSGFAEKRIRGAVFDELRRGDVLPRRTRWAARKVSETIGALELRLGRRPEDTDVAAALGVSIEVYREQLAVLTNVSFVDVDSHALGDAGESAEQSPSDVAERKQLVARVRQCLTLMPEREALILSLYYIEEFSYAQIAKVLSVSESRVCQLHARALVLMRTAFDRKMNAAKKQRTPVAVDRSFFS